MIQNAIDQIIATELKIQSKQISAVMTLLDEGATIPFIARYRKEATGGLDDTQLRQIDARLTYLSELFERKKTILKSIQDQGKLTAELESKINQTLNKTELEDLYLPYKPKRRTKGQIAIEAGLEPLADQLWQNPQLDPELTAQAFIDPEKNILDTKSALDGARFILMERFSEDADLLAKVRTYLWQNAHLTSKVMSGKEQMGDKFKDYFAYAEPIAKIPSHRALALFRGRNEGILSLSLNPDPQFEEPPKISYGEQLIQSHLKIDLAKQPADLWRQSVISWTWKVKVLLHLETELLMRLKEQAEQGAITVFADNLQDMLMAAPAGLKVTMGMDPGLRTGVKIAVVDATGKLITTETIYPHTGQFDKALQIIAALCLKHKVELVAIGNGTASRETERFFKEVVKKYPEIKAQKVIVSEAGASVYSASELAAAEFPELDVSLRGAVSIARRLQDPMAELVKIDPKSIGVGQYQHDVSQTQLAHKLDEVVEDCVNKVGVDLNTASVMLLSRIAGLNKTIAQNIVDFRDQAGQFKNRKQLLKVARLGPKAFEQCAGFLRISKGENPLDASAVHPESYPVVERILSQLHLPLEQLMGDSKVIQNIKPSDFVDAQFGLPTVVDILKELDKPGRDPRPEFKTAQFDDAVETMEDLKVGMILEGTVTNVTSFGAFVDIGVHQDGLVHISVLAHRFVEDPRTVVKTGDIVKVKVMEVEIARKRIALSMRLDDSTAPSGDSTVKSSLNLSAKNDSQKRTTQSLTKNTKTQSAPINSAMGNAFLNALNQKTNKK